MTDVKETKPNETYQKAEWWYENHPSGPFPKHKRNIGRDCACIKRGFFGTQSEWEVLCRSGWAHLDPSVRHYSLLRIPSFVALIPSLIEIKRTPEEIAANIAAVNAAVEIAVKGVKVNNPPKFEKDTVRGGWKRA